MIKTNNGSLLLRLEQKILESINLYVDSGEQFLNLPDPGVFDFDDEFLKFKAKNIQKVVFCLDNNKFYLLSNGGSLPSDKFVVLFDEEKYGYNIPDILTAELMKNVLLTRFSEGKFGIFSCDDFYQLIFKYHKRCDSKSSDLDLDERNFRTALRRYKFSNTNSDFEVELKDFVFDVFFKGETKYAIISLEKGWFTTQLKDFLFNFINSEDKLLFLFKNLTNPFGRKNLLFSISKKIPEFSLLNFYKNLLLDYKEISVADLILVANELGDDFFKLFEDSNLKLKVTPKFNKDYFEKFNDENFELDFEKLVEEKRIEMIDLEILINKMERHSEYLKNYQNSLQKRLDRGDLEKSTFESDLSRFNTECIEFNIALKILTIFNKQLSEQENDFLLISLKKIRDNLTGTGFSGRFGQIHEN